MCNWLASIRSLQSRFAKAGAVSAALTAVLILLSATAANAQETAGGEAGLKLPDLSQGSASCGASMVISFLRLEFCFAFSDLSSAWSYTAA